MTVAAFSGVNGGSLQAKSRNHTKSFIPYGANLPPTDDHVMAAQSETDYGLKAAAVIPGGRQQPYGPHLSTQSQRREARLEAAASCPPTAYRKPFQVATPTPPRGLAMGLQPLHLLVWGSKHSTELRQALPSRPPTAYSLQDKQPIRAGAGVITWPLWRRRCVPGPYISISIHILFYTNNIKSMY